MSTYPKTALVINCGSSSVKFAILDPKDGHVFLNGIAEALGLADARISWKFNGGEKTETQLGAGADHSKALEFLVKNVLAKDEALHDSIVACGHRIVQGGDIYSQPTLIDDEVEENIKKVIPFAPLHNPAHLLGIDAARANFPSIPHVAVFDTAFHQTMPKEAYMYALPYEYYEKYKVRRYGFHGTSHSFVSKRTAEFLGKDVKDMKIVVCHLGNGSSVTAVKNGESIDTSMGLTPLEGVPMGTRSGDLDPAILEFLAKKENMDVFQLVNVLNKKSGVFGLSKELSSDFRDLEIAALDGNHQAQMARDVFTYNVAKYVGAYAAAMNGVDAIAFTAGVGENDHLVREDVVKRLGYLGIELDAEANKKRGDDNIISTADSKVTVCVIPTNEELAIARETLALVK